MKCKFIVVAFAVVVLFQNTYSIGAWVSEWTTIEKFGFRSTYTTMDDNRPWIVVSNSEGPFDGGYLFHEQMIDDPGELQSLIAIIIDAYNNNRLVRIYHDDNDKKYIIRINVR